MAIRYNPFTGDLQFYSESSGSTNIKQTEIDFGSVPISEASFIVVDSDVISSSKLIGNIAYEAPTGKDIDELDMDIIDLKFTSGLGQFTVYVKGLEGYLHDKFKINYLVG